MIRPWSPIPCMVVAVLLALLATPAGGQPFVRGDLSNDGVLSVSDMSQLLGVLSGVGGTITPLDTADLNDNEIVNFVDYFALQAFLFSELPFSPPSPFPASGSDVDDDLGTMGSVQPGYSAQLMVTEITPTEVRLTLHPEAPQEVRGLEVLLQFSPAFDLDAAELVVAGGATNLSSSLLIHEGDTMAIFVGSFVRDIRPDPAFSPATLVVPHDGTIGQCPILPAITALPEATLFGVTHRAEIANPSVQGFHPSIVWTPCPETDKWFVRGDCNADGAFDTADAVTALQAFFLGGPIGCFVACDVNDDDRADLGDPIYMFQFLLQGGPPPPSGPFTTCGIDPNEGPLSCATFDACP